MAPEEPEKSQISGKMSSTEAKSEVLDSFNAEVP